eukprot:TRINITY_DN702_c0_g1_i3.p1 TRINITY_DN702_c0_g1~~TRINITY_DN702_c0_g1_i3.p1  ORF type:complete len:307 (+),score=61.87 TRINITY_DN702_c0_g1_i3:209-1129(+)
MAIRILFVACLLAVAMAHDHGLPINPELGVPGFPDCVRQHPDRSMNVSSAAEDLVCSQHHVAADVIKIGMIGDSITAGVHSSGGNHTYPAQMQLMLDAQYGPGKYSVTNLGACGSTMLKKGDSPFWKRPQFAALNAGKWDIITIMLGTNDAKDPGSHGPNNWQHDCGGAEHPTVEGCSFAQDYASMIALVNTLGTTPAGPKVYVMTPPPLMALNAYGMNQTVINSVFPKLVPLIAQSSPGVHGPIDVFGAMGGVSNWETMYPPSCAIGSAWPQCGYYCDAQSCDQCHPDDNGYAALAKAVKAGLGL